MNNNVVVVLYETLLSVPSMNETVKVDLRISRKLILLLKQVIETGLLEQQKEPTGLLAAMPVGAADELMELMAECMNKAGLTELYEKLKSLGAVQQLK